MQSDSDIADYTYRIKDAWKVGQAGKNNGVVLFVFLEDRKCTSRSAMAWKAHCLM